MKVIATLLFVMFAALVTIGWFGVVNASPDAFDQATFPCQEDEVLGYAPEFGPDQVGCIHTEELQHPR